MTELNKISNQQLIEDFGIIGDYYIDMIHEFYLRYQSDKVTDEELKKFKKIGDRVKDSWITRFQKIIRILRNVIQMPNKKIQECLSINKKDIDVIGNALEEYWSLEYHNGHTINQINDTRMRVKKIKEQMEKLGEIKICWG